MELGQSLEINNSKFLGIFEHMYHDSVASSDIGTHYVSIALETLIDKTDNLKIPIKQHDKYRWFKIEELLKDNQVHEKTKEFFDINLGIRQQ